ncbi:hypothetical protein EBH_0039940 [Eimeria brunetti]|uniref:Uncharacterized protein n=1 Tax=Eimeria brunetti TaxID=51314 RepID=U6LPJ3_9EIME|nr:hypothetical protein EBH_0039940 [Eimeria brunetti]
MEARDSQGEGTSIPASPSSALLGYSSSRPCGVSAPSSTTPPVSLSPILRKSGSLTSPSVPGSTAAAAAAAAAAAGAAAGTAAGTGTGTGTGPGTAAAGPTSSSCATREDDRRREFQRIKTVSFANLDSVAGGAPSPAAEGDSGAGESAFSGVRLEGVSSPGQPLTDDETEHRSISAVSGAWALYPHSYNSSSSNISLYLPFGNRFGSSYICCCCSRLCRWCRRLGPGNDLAFHTREDLLLQQQQQQKRHARLTSRSSTLSNSSGAARSSSMRGSSSAEKLLKPFPLAFTSSELEDLFSLNVNHWMRVRMFPMGVLLLLLTLAMWPLLAWSFDQQSAFDHRSSIGIMFNVAMGITMLSSAALAAAACIPKANAYAEHITMMAVFVVSQTLNP